MASPKSLERVLTQRVKYGPITLLFQNDPAGLFFTVRAIHKFVQGNQTVTNPAVAVKNIKVLIMIYALI